MISPLLPLGLLGALIIMFVRKKAEAQEGRRRRADLPSGAPGQPQLDASRTGPSAPSGPIVAAPVDPYGPEYVNWRKERERQIAQETGGSTDAARQLLTEARRRNAAELEAAARKAESENLRASSYMLREELARLKAQSQQSTITAITSGKPSDLNIAAQQAEYAGNYKTADVLARKADEKADKAERKELAQTQKVAQETGSKEAAQQVIEKAKAAPAPVVAQAIKKAEAQGLTQTASVLREVHTEKMEDAKKAVVAASQSGKLADLKVAAKIADDAGLKKSAEELKRKEEEKKRLQLETSKAMMIYNGAMKDSDLNRAAQASEKLRQAGYKTLADDIKERVNKQFTKDVDAEKKFQEALKATDINRAVQTSIELRKAGYGELAAQLDEKVNKYEEGTKADFAKQDKLRALMEEAVKEPEDAQKILQIRDQIAKAGYPKQADQLTRRAHGLIIFQDARKELQKPQPDIDFAFRIAQELERMQYLETASNIYKKIDEVVARIQAEGGFQKPKTKKADAVPAPSQGGADRGIMSRERPKEYTVEDRGIMSRSKPSTPSVSGDAAMAFIDAETNGHAANGSNGHENGHVNDHANGHVNGHANGAAKNGATKNGAAPAPETQISRDDWNQFLKASVVAKPDQVIYGNTPAATKYGIFGISLMRLCDLGVTQNPLPSAEKVNVNGSEKTVWGAVWKDPDQSTFLSSITVQRKVFARQMAGMKRFIFENFSEYLGRDLDGQKITLSGLLAISHHTRNLRSWLDSEETRKKFVATTEAFNRANGIF